MMDVFTDSEDDLIPPELSSKVHGRVNEYLQQRLDDPAFHSRLYVNEQDQLLAKAKLRLVWSGCSSSQSTTADLQRNPRTAWLGSAES